jgi:uncharacterized protein YecE (DUF72 family)
MKLYTGTSGFSYREWVGNFYPDKIKPEGMLVFYAEKLGIVEINNTFYRLPKREVLEHWKNETPAHFLFSIKASRKITHIKRLSDAEEETGYLIDNLKALGEKLGAILFQFPPYFKKNIDRFSNYLKILPDNLPAVFEFRDDSWYDAEIAGLLRERNFIFCFSDMDEKEKPEIISTAGWGYLRLRREKYTERDLASWAAAIKARDWEKVFVFFKHEDGGTGPKLAEKFSIIFNS